MQKSSQEKSPKKDDESNPSCRKEIQVYAHWKGASREKHKTENQDNEWILLFLPLSIKLLNPAGKSSLLNFNFSINLPMVK